MKQLKAIDIPLFTICLSMLTMILTVSCQPDQKASENGCIKFGNEAVQACSCKSDDEISSCLSTLAHEDIRQNPEVRDYLATHPVYVSLTTSPSRLQNILPVLKTIDETLISEILLVLPKQYQNKESYPDPLPSIIINFPRIKILRPDSDLGPITKLIPAIEYANAKDPKSIVITIDDDIGYSKGIFGQLIKYLILNKAAAAVGTKGSKSLDFNLKTTANVFSNKCEKNGICDLIEGFGAVAYRVEKMPIEDLKKYSNANPLCILSDDLVINYALAKHGLDRHRVDNQFTPGIIALPHGFGPDALHKQNDYKISYQKCIQAIESVAREDNCPESPEDAKNRPHLIEEKAKEKGHSSFAEEVKDFRNIMNGYPVRDLSHDQKVMQYLHEHKVYISLTTSPVRIKTLSYVLDSLNLQYVNEILLNLPERFGRDNCPYDIPDGLEGSYNGKLKILRVPVDLGPITKLLPAVEYAQSKGDKDAIIITIDDDTAYPIGMIPEMIYNIVHHENTVVSGSGQNIDFWLRHRADLEMNPLPKPYLFPGRHLPGSLGGDCKQVPDPAHDPHWNSFDATSSCDVVEGFGSIGYRAGLVDVDLMKKLRNVDFLEKVEKNGKMVYPKDCFASDDVIISFALGLSGVNRRKIAWKYHSHAMTRQFAFGFLPDALHEGGGLEATKNDKLISEKKGFDQNFLKYNKCYDRLMKVTYDHSANKFKSPEVVKADERLSKKD